jgi:hypothetical protein
MDLQNLSSGLAKTLYFEQYSSLPDPSNHCSALCTSEFDLLVLKEEIMQHLPFFEWLILFST